jgi:Flp pilus assembly protein TadD
MTLWQLHAETESWRAARDDFAAITTRHATAGIGFKYLGMACDRLDEPAAARAAYEAAARLRPGDREVTGRLRELRGNRPPR